jgi:Tfp pilus assembly protein PilZ
MTFDHPALDMVMDQVAGCLSSVHQLARYQPPAAPAPAHAAPTHAAPTHAAPQATPAHDGAVTVAAPAGYAVAAAATAPVALGGTQVLSAPSPAAFPAPPQQAPQPAPQYHQPVPQPAPQAAFQAPIPQPAPAPQPVAAPHRQAFSSPNQTVRLQPNAQQVAAQAAHAAVQATAPAPFAQPAAPVAPAPAQQAATPAAARAPLPSTPQASPSQSGNVVVELGTHSVSNFYKGLGGNDVIEHGGIFVATYKIPKMGAQVNLRVLLPGDYEFQAAGVVQWIREPHSGGDSSEPGFGARFVQITPEGRQLVYRYTRNREPMFYDDL